MTPDLTVEDVLDYLRARGWTMTGRWRNAAVWSLGEFDVLVPPNDTLADAPGRLRELVMCVADSEGRTPRSVGRDIALPAVDVVSFRTRDPENSISLPTGVRSLCAARDVVVTCAQEVAVGTTETVDTLLDRSFLSLSDEVFGVDVAIPYDTLGRGTALQVLRSASTVLTAVDTAEQVSRTGLSTTFLAALANLAGQGRRAPFELGFRWSRRAPLKDEELRFPSGAGERIHAAAKRTEPSVAGAAGVVEGPVLRLSDNVRGERWRIDVRGLLRVDGTVVGRRRLVPVWLASAEDYDAALVAHREKQTVRVRGVITSRRGITAADDGFTVIART
jgi:hypothetical protein